MFGYEVKGSGERGTAVAGRLNQEAQVWREREMGASPCVMQIIEDSFRLPFINLPSPKVFRNHGSCSLHAEFTTEAVATLVAQGCAVEVGWEEVMVFSPLVVHNNGT